MSTLGEITEAEFDTLASGLGGPNVIQKLQRTRVARHIVMIRTMQQLAADVAPDSVASLESAYELLAAARERDAEATSAVLGHPAVGAWLAACLRRSPSVADGPHPPGVEMEQLGAVAAAAALGAGLTFELTVPRRRGAVFLPGLGTAQFADPTGPVTIRYDGARARIEADGRSITVPNDLTGDDDGWLGVRRLSSDVDGVVIDVELDDVDPLRTRHGETIAPRQGVTELAAWQRLLTAAWHVLVRDYPEWAAELRAGLTAIIPLAGCPAGTTRNITARHAFGSVYATLAGTGQTFANSLIHEYQSSKLCALADVVLLHTADPGPMYYSPWRGDPCPLEALLYGAYSHIGVTDYWDVQRRLVDDDAERDYAEFEFCWRSRQVVAAIDVLLDSGHLTVAGARFVRGMTAAVARRRAPTLRPQVGRLADLATVDHRIRWQLRNRWPDTGAVRLLADLWRSRADCPWDPREVRSSLLPRARKQHMSDRLRLIQCSLRQPATFDTMYGDTARLAQIGGTLHPADVALLRGDRDRAYEGYRSRIAHNGDDVEAWAGLALSRYTADPGAADAPVWGAPEVLMALHCELTAETGIGPDVGELAAWLVPADKSI